MKQLIRIGFIGLVVMTLVLPLAVQGEAGEASVYLTIEDAEALLLEENTSLKALEVTEMEILTSFNDVKAAGDSLESIYDQLTTYTQVYNLYNSTMENEAYSQYFALVNSGVGLGYEDDFDGYTVNLALEDPIANASLIDDLETRINLEASFTEEDYGSIITSTQYTQYQVLYNIFDALDMSDPNAISDEEIYDTFIKTMKVTPLSLQLSLAEVQLSGEVLSASLVSGMKALYDNILSLEVTEDLMYQSYVVAKDQAEASDARLAIGFESEADNRQSHIDASIALLNYQSMSRQVDNLMMALKEMLGLDPMVHLNLNEDVTVSQEIEGLEVYLSSALMDRNELTSIENDIRYKAYELETMSEWLKDSDSDVMDANEALLRLERDLIQGQKEVEADVMKAYNNVLVTQNALIEAQGNLGMAEKDHEEMVLRVELGQILDADLNALEIGLISSEASLLTAEINYRSAVMALENASSIGPGYE